MTNSLVKKLQMKLKDWEQHSSRYCSASIIVVVKSLSVVQKRFFGGGLGSEGLHSYHAAHLCPFVKSSESVIEFTASQVYSHCCGSSRLFLKIKTKQTKKKKQHPNPEGSATRPENRVPGRQIKDDERQR